VRIFEYHRSHLHAKVAVVDEHWATVGSSNIDPFSLLLAREANVFVRNPGFAAHLKWRLERAIAAGAREISPTPGNAAPPAAHPQLGRVRAGAPDDRHRRLRQPALNGNGNGMGNGKIPPPPTPTPHHVPRSRLRSQDLPARGPAPAHRRLPRPLVFTNGCFDILHRGHVTYLGQARALGAAMVVALNSDASVRRQGKGDDRPINPRRPPGRDGRPRLRRPRHLVRRGHPDRPHPRMPARRAGQGRRLGPERIVGAPETLARGGTVHSIPFEHQRSTTALLDKIRRL
jgi:cytidyltransferase-like protein